MLRHSVSALFSTRLAGIWHLAINSNTGYQWLPFCPSFADWEIFDYLWLFYTSQKLSRHILQICQKPWQNLLQFSRRVKPIQNTSATQKYQFSFRCKHLEVWYGLVWFGGVFGEPKFFERGIRPYFAVRFGSDSWDLHRGATDAHGFSSDGSMGKMDR